ACSTRAECSVSEQPANASVRGTRQVFKTRGRRISSASPYKDTNLRVISIVLRTVAIGVGLASRSRWGPAAALAREAAAQASFWRNSCLNARSRPALELALIVQCPSFRLGLGSLP